MDKIKKIVDIIGVSISISIVGFIIGLAYISGKLLIISKVTGVHVFDIISRNFLNIVWDNAVYFIADQLVVLIVVSVVLYIMKKLEHITYQFNIRLEVMVILLIIMYIILAVIGLSSYNTRSLTTHKILKWVLYATILILSMAEYIYKQMFSINTKELQLKIKRINNKIKDIDGDLLLDEDIFSNNQWLENRSDKSLKIEIWNGLINYIYYLDKLLSVGIRVQKKIEFQYTIDIHVGRINKLLQQIQNNKRIETEYIKVIQRSFLWHLRYEYIRTQCERLLDKIKTTDETYIKIEEGILELDKLVIFGREFSNEDGETFREKLNVLREEVNKIKSREGVKGYFGDIDKEIKLLTKSINNAQSHKQESRIIEKIIQFIQNIYMSNLRKVGVMLGSLIGIVLITGMIKFSIQIYDDPNTLGAATLVFENGTEEKAIIINNNNNNLLYYDIFKGEIKEREKLNSTYGIEVIEYNQRAEKVKKVTGSSAHSENVIEIR